MDQAEHYQRESVETARKLFGDEHPEVAFSVGRLANILRIKRDYAASEVQFREALRIQRATLPEGHWDISLTVCRFGHLMVQKGETSEAETLIQECLETRRKQSPQWSWGIAYTESLLGACRVAQSRFAEAETLLLRAVAGISEQPGSSPSSKGNIEVLQRVIDLYDAWDAAEPGKGYAEKAAEWRAKLETGNKKLETGDETPERQKVETSKP